MPPSFNLAPVLGLSRRAKSTPNGRFPGRVAWRFEPIEEQYRHPPDRSHVNLFTDLANPTSNSIYRKLGYQPIGDHRHYMFED
jgi:hypothetical protein